MSEDEEWNMWQTYVAVGGAVAGALIFGKYYNDEKTRLKDREDLLQEATKTLKDSTVIITGANTGVGMFVVSCSFWRGGCSSLYFSAI